MAEIMELAQQLGKKIAESPASKNVQQAHKEVEADAELAQTLQEYQAQAEKISQLEAENKPVEVDEKRTLQNLHDKLVASDKFKKFSAAQVEYIDLMRKVNQAIQGQLAQ
jgi:cell fate (sporulation/competence/biofilm development) regulator YlbF (YheA/YmcA/DUF963 family)